MTEHEVSKETENGGEAPLPADYARLFGPGADLLLRSGRPRQQPFMAADLIRIWEEHLAPVQMEAVRLHFCKMCPETDEKIKNLRDNLEIMIAIAESTESELEVSRKKCAKLRENLDAAIELGVEYVKKEQLLIADRDFLLEIPKTVVEWIADVLFDFSFGFLGGKILQIDIPMDSRWWIDGIVALERLTGLKLYQKPNKYIAGVWKFGFEVVNPEKFLDAFGLGQKIDQIRQDLVLLRTEIAKKTEKR